MNFENIFPFGNVNSIDDINRFVDDDDNNHNNNNNYNDDNNTMIMIMIIIKLSVTLLYKLSFSLPLSLLL